MPVRRDPGPWGVDLVAADGARVVGSTFTAAPDAPAARAVRVTAASRGVRLVDDDCTGLTAAAAFTDAAADTVVRGNLGATTEAAGTASVAPGTTWVTVQHRLSGSGRVPSAEHVTVVPTGPVAAGSRSSSRASPGRPSASPCSPRRRSVRWTSPGAWT